MSVLGSIGSKEDFEALWERLRAEKRRMSTDERLEEIERDVLMLQVGQARTTDVLAELARSVTELVRWQREQRDRGAGGVT